MTKPPDITAQQPWHHWTINQVFEQLQSGANGLSYVGARQRLRHYGSNKLPRQRQIYRILRQPLVNPLTYALLAIVAVLQYLNSMNSIEGWVLLAIGTLYALFGILLSVWSMRTRDIASLGRPQRRQNVPSQEATVIRDGETMSLPARDLVMGDVILLQAGDRPSADIRLFASDDLHVNQTNLGGVAITPKCASDEIELDTPVLERVNLVYAGTEIIGGKGSGVVVTTGKAAYWQSSMRYQQVFSVTHSQLYRLRQVWAIVTVLAGVAIAAAALIRGINLVDAVALFAAIALSTHPQQLLRLATQAQLLGMKDLAKKRLWVRFPGAMDELGRVNTIVLILESDTALPIDRLAIAGTNWRGLIRASEADANALGSLLGLEVNSYFAAPLEQVRTWQAEGQVVAAFGKDPEDMALLRQADLGIADRNCKKVIQDSAGLILPKEDLHYLPVAIAEGRAVIDRLQRLVLLLLSSTGAILLLASLAIATNRAVIALIPLQILWVGAAAAPLVAWPSLVEPSSANIIARSARSFQTILPPGNYLRLGLAITAITAASLAVFWLKYQGVSAALVQARTMAFTTLTLSQAFHACSLSRRSLITHMPLTFALIAIVAIQIAIVQMPGLGDAFSTVPLDYTEWTIAVLAATPVFWLQEMFRTN